MSNIIMIDQHNRPAASVRLAKKAELTVTQATGSLLVIAAIIVMALFRINPAQLL
ncbi:MAG: hypothetical protein WC856_02155 [Methylococcaceae bacterium]|jgi:hypothetical protein